MLKDKFISAASSLVVHKNFSSSPYMGEPVFDDGTLLRDTVSAFDIVVYAHHVIEYSNQADKWLYEQNVLTIKDVVNICIEFEIKGLLYLGSNEALDRNTEGFPVKEEDTWQKKKYRSPYSKSRFLGEMELWRAQAEGIHTMIISLSPMFTFPLESHTLRYIYEMAMGQSNYLPKSIIAFCDERSASEFVTKAIKDPKCWNNKYLLADGHASMHTIANVIRNKFNKTERVYQNLTFIRYLFLEWINKFKSDRFYLYRTHFNSLQLNQNFDHTKALHTGYYHPIVLQEVIDYWVKNNISS